MDADSTYHNFVQALAFINTAIRVHADRAPFHHFVAGGQLSNSRQKFGVSIYERDRSRPVDHFTIQLVEGRFVLIEHGVSHSRPDWTLSADHVQEIARNPLRFFDNPSSLDLEWHEDRLDSGAADPTI